MKDANGKTLVIGGIYREKRLVDEDECFLCMGQDAFYTLFDGISHIEEDVLLGQAHAMELLEGYTLAINKIEKRWMIRCSGRKNQADYIADEGRYFSGFEKSLSPIMKVFHKTI